MEYNSKESPELFEQVNKENPLKTWLVEYVGEQLNPTDDEVNVEMIIEVMAKEFPEFLLPIAEENFIRGYRQAMTDVKYSDDIANKVKKKA